MSIQKWTLSIALALFMAGCGGGSGGGSVPDNRVTVSGQVVLAADKNLNNAKVEISDIDSLRSGGNGQKVTTEPTVGASGEIVFKIDSVKLDDTKLYRVIVQCETRSDACHLTKPLSAVISGRRIKLGNWTINALTEIVYQRLAYYIAADYTETDLQEEMDTIAAMLLQRNVADSRTLDYEDILRWTPTFDINALKRPNLISSLTLLLEDSEDENAVQLEVQKFFKSAVGAIDTPGTASGIALADTYAYIPDGASGLQIVDVSTPSTPVLIGSIDTAGEAVDVAVMDHFAFVAEGGTGLQIFDISTPSAPKLVGSLDTPGNAQEIVVSGHYAFVAAGTSGLQIIDIGQPDSPVLVGTLESSAGISDVSVSGRYAYVVEGSSGLRIVDVITPNSPIPVGALNTLGNALCVSGNYAYVLARDSLKIIDVSTPNAPVLVGTLEAADSEYFGELAVADGRAYVSNSASFDILGINVIDVTTPTAPVLVDSVNLPDDASALAVSNGYVYTVTFREGLQINEISQIAAPINVSSFDFGRILSMTLSDSYILSSWGMLISLDDPTVPRVVVSDLLDSKNSNPVIAGNHVYGESHSLDQGISGFDISNPLAPILIGEISTYNPTFIEVSGQYVYAADDWGGLKILDFGSDTTPTMIGNISIDNPEHYGATYARNVAVSGNYAFVTYAPEESIPSGVVIIDVADPAVPITLGYYVGVAPLSIVISGQYAYLPDGGSLHIVDFSDPSHPILVGSILSSVKDVKISGKYAYVIDEHTLQVIDISTPSRPIIVGVIRTQAPPSNVELKGDYIYVGTVRGLEVHRILPES